MPGKEDARGLIHSRASKKRAKAEAELLKEQTRQLKDERRDEARERAGDYPWRQPTVSDAIASWQRTRK